MSNVSNRHAMVPFVSGETKPLSTQRLAKVGYKQTAAMTARGEIAPTSVAVSVPQIDPADVMANVQALLPHIGTLLENAQDGIIRSLYESAGHTVRDITDDEISVQACINFLNADQSGGRLTTEGIGAWFDSEIAEQVLFAIVEKLGFTDMNDDQMKVAEKHVNVYRQMVCMLGGNKVSLTPVQDKAIRKAIGFAGADDMIGKKLVAKLDAMAGRDTELLLAL